MENYRLFKKIALIILGFVTFAVLLVLGLACTKPDTMKVERSISISQAPEKIVPLVDNFHNWLKWSPWENIDPQMKRSFSGSESGKGAIYNWDGNDDAGAGRMEILDSSPSAVAIRLDFSRPFEGHYQTSFSLEPNGAATKLSWIMTGPNTFLSKIIQVLLDMDQMIGGQYEKGLSKLKQLAEALSSPQQ